MIFCLGNVSTRRANGNSDGSAMREGVGLRRGSKRMENSAAENPTRMRICGMRKYSRCDRLRLSRVISLCSIAVRGMQIAAIMDENVPKASITMSERRILAISLYLRKYLRRVMRVASCEDDESAHMQRTRTKCAPWTSCLSCPIYVVSTWR